MSLISEVANFAFVYRNGVVILKPKDPVREMTELRLNDVRAAVAPITDFPAPELLGLRPSGYEPPEQEFESAERSISVGSGVLLIRQTERAHREIAKVPRPFGARVIPSRALGPGNRPRAAATARGPRRVDRRRSAS